MQLSLLLLLIVLAKSSLAEIYKWKDKNGVTHYSESKPVEISEVEEIVVQSYQSVFIETSDKNIDLIPNKKNLVRKRPQKVVMYSAEWCGVCKKAKKYFKKEKIRYKDYDIDKSKSARARYNKLGAKGVPVILVGKDRMNGFSVGGFKKLYKK